MYHDTFHCVIHKKDPLIHMTYIKVFLASEISAMHFSESNGINVLVIPIAVAADTLVYVVLILLGIQFPAWLYPCLFYVQVHYY